MRDVILLPTYNEKKNVEIIISRIFSLIPDINILVIDDNSPDKTAEVVESLMSKYKNLSILRRAKKTGLGDAYKNGIKKVIGDKNIRAIITMDADGSHAPEYIPDLLAKIDDYDLVIGSRYIKNGGVEKWEYWRKILSRLGNLYAKALTGLKINDLTAGFMCVKRECLEKINLDKINSTGYSFLIELKFYLINITGARVFEAPIIFKSRREGESKLSRHIIREGIKTPLNFFWRRIWRKI